MTKADRARKLATVSDRARALHTREPALTESEIAQRLGVDRQLVHAALRRSSTKGRPRKERTPAERAAEAARLQAAARRMAAGT